MSYSLQKIDSGSVSAIRENWFGQLDELEEDCAYLDSSIERLIDWCEKSLASDDPICLWAVCHEGNNTPRAIVEISDARKSKDPAFKFLSLYLEPKLILDCKDVITKDDLMDAIGVIAFAMIESFRMAIENGTRKLKVFGRTDEMRNVFDTLVAITDPTDFGAQLYRQGKWLVIERGR